MNWIKRRGKFIWTSGAYKVRLVTARLGSFERAFEALHDGQSIGKKCYGYASEARRACEEVETELQVFMRERGQVAGPEVRP